jgi:aldose 1-epimerase
MEASAPMPTPSGRQIILTHRDQQLSVVEVGGGLRTYTVAGSRIVDGYGEVEMCSGGRGQVLMPWPNRLGDGRFEWDGRALQTALTEPEHHNAIHGLVRWAPWTVAEEAADRARLTYRLYPQPGWPWILDLSVTYALSDEGLEVSTTAVNLPGGAGPCPFGAGWHPYLFAFGALVDDAAVTVKAETTYLVDDRGLPTGTRPVDGTDVDFRAGRRIGAAKLDSAFTDLARDGDGRAVVELSAAEAAGEGARDGAAEGSVSSVRLWMDRAFTHLMIYSGDTLAEVDRRRRGLAVEPMTCAPDMLRNGDGRLVLEEGEIFEARWGLAATSPR